MIYAYAKVVENDGVWGLAPTEWNDLDMDWAVGMYTRFHNVTDAHPGLKVSTAVYKRDRWTGGLRTISESVFWVRQQRLR